MGWLPSPRQPRNRAIYNATGHSQAACWCPGRAAGAGTHLNPHPLAELRHYLVLPLHMAVYRLLRHAARSNGPPHARRGGSIKIRSLTLMQGRQAGGQQQSVGVTLVAILWQRLRQASSQHPPTSSRPADPEHGAQCELQDAPAPPPVTPAAAGRPALRWLPAAPRSAAPAARPAPRPPAGAPAPSPPLPWWLPAWP